MTDLSAAFKTLKYRIGTAASGDKVQKTLKRQAKKTLALALKIICRAINQQHKGDTDILIGSGATMAKNSNRRKLGLLPVAEGIYATVGLYSDELKLKVKKIKGLNNDGTRFAYTEALNAPDDINEWNWAHSTCHHQTIEGLKRGVKYLISAAYQGTRNTPYNWCSPISIYTKAG